MTSALRFPPWRRLVVLAVFGLLACRDDAPVGEADAPRELAFAFCDAVFACNCAVSAGFSSIEGCRETTGQSLLDQQSAAISGALVYDGTCVDAQIGRIEELGCSRDPAELEQCNDCFTYHGFLPEGSDCDRVGPRASTCAQGLACADRFDAEGNVVNVCVKACERVGAGEACYLEGPEYIVTRTCDEGLFCDTNSTGVCFRLPKPGEVCQAGACAPGAWCDTSAPTAICAANKVDGAGCGADLECDSTWCRADRCTQPLAIGSLCVPGQDRCVVGSVCVEERAQCVKTDALVCGSPQIVL